jgi:hypothetical protein
MTTRCWYICFLLAIAGGFASCVGPVPNERDLDHAYQRSMTMAQQEITELDVRRARGEISATDYAMQKQAILDRVLARANDMVLTEHSLVESQRQALGLPTPSSPQVIVVPQAGSLATGSTQKRFNDADATGFGAGPQTALQDLSGGYTPGGGVRGTVMH